MANVDPNAVAGEPATADSGGSAGLRIVLMAVATLAVGFFVYRTVMVEPVGPAGSTSYRWEVVRPDGVPVNLASYRGRPVLLNVWATWCPPCLMEMPSIVALSERPELAEADVAVLLVSTDQDLETVQQFLARTDVGHAEVVVANGPPPVEFLTDGIPATFLIAPDGQIARRVIGSTDWNTDEVVDTLVGLADEG